jgi:hypothetical protein
MVYMNGSDVGLDQAWEHVQDRRAVAPVKGWDYNKQGGVKGAMFAQRWYREADGTVVNLPWDVESILV